MADDVDRLYDLPLEEFVPERDALAKRLRADGQREEANAVKALRKPSVAAWAVNQALRSKPEVAKALLEAGDALRSAQEELLSGSGDVAAARTASDAERRAIGSLVDAARGLAREGGFLSAGVIDKVRETLHAAAADDEAREEVASARVSKERRAAAFGGLNISSLPEAPAKPKRKVKKKPIEGEDDSAARAADEERRAEEQRAREAEKERRRTAREALTAAKRAERDAGRRRREAEAALAAAEEAVEDARAALEEARTEERDAVARRETAEADL